MISVCFPFPLLVTYCSFIRKTKMDFWRLFLWAVFLACSSGTVEEASWTSGNVGEGFVAEARGASEICRHFLALLKQPVWNQVPWGNETAGLLKGQECQAVGLAGWSELALVVGELILTTAVALVGSGGTGWIARGPAYRRAPPKGADALLPSALQTIICWSKLELRQVLRVHLDRCQVCLSPWTARQESNEVWMTRLLCYSEVLGH